MRHEDILSLLDGVLTRLQDSDIRTLVFEVEGVSLRVDRCPPESAPVLAATAGERAGNAWPGVTAPGTVEGAVAPGRFGKPGISGMATDKNTQEDVYRVSSPVVGSFYAAPSPDAPPFVTIGSRVEKGDILCIIEAMKTFNEIESEQAGTISRIAVQNGDLVEYGQVLFELESEPEEGK